MAIAVKHKFQSLKGDGADATLIRPSNWNDTHDLTMATSNILGRLSAGSGAAEEIPATAYMLGLLAKTDYLALAAALGLPTTGDARLTFKSVADAGWVLANDGSIGSASSGATTRANADTQALFTFFYNGFSDTIAPLQTSVGGATTRVAQGTATVAYTANCRIVLPRALGRALIVGGSAGSGLTARALGSWGGEENHLLTPAEMASHNHTVTVSGTGTGGAGSGTGTASVSGSYSGNTGTESADHTHATSSSGTSNAADRSLDHLHSNSYACNNVSSTGGGGFATGYQQSINTGAMDRSIDHLHGVNVSGTSGGRSAAHTHSFSGSVSSSGSCTVNSVTVSVSASGTTANGVGITQGAVALNDQAHNNMQPWAAWSVMIRL